jgi:type I restriction enzyme S subunit
LWSIQGDLAAYEHTGTVFGAINKLQFEALKMTAPQPRVVDAFEGTVTPLDERIRSNETEGVTLGQTRDLLLPKLMSGEVRVREADKIAEAAL